MPSKIRYQTWSGGSGMGDPAILIGYCKESPEEALRYLSKNYNIYLYKHLYRPVDDRFPNNVEGLIIEDANSEFETNFKGCSICVNNSIVDLNITCAKSKESRSMNIIKKSFEVCKRFHLDNLTNKKWIKIYNQEIQEAGAVLNNLDKS